jgi:hypothetical protein
LRGIPVTVAYGDARVLADTCARTVNSSVGALLKRIAGSSAAVTLGTPGRLPVTVEPGR